MNDQSKAIEALAYRRAHAPKRMDMDKLPAGAPMTYYCRECSAVSDVLPEEHLEKPKRLCDDCTTIIQKGWLLSPFPTHLAVPTPTPELPPAEPDDVVQARRQVRRLVAHIFAQRLDLALFDLRNECLELRDPVAHRYFKSGYQHGIAEAREALLRIRAEFCSGSDDS